MDRIGRMSRTDQHRVYSGQVILDPAAVVKELLENALDSGATRVEVRVRGKAALRSIAVTDNGSGIAREDLEMLCLPSATSKIKSFEDITSLRTMGFRGEALSAIASLSERIVVLTKTDKEDVGTVAEYGHSGSLQNKQPAPRTVGTTVTAENVFARLPVRRKEAEHNAKREVSRIVSTVQTFGLICFGVKISLAVESSTVLQTSGRSMKDDIQIREDQGFYGTVTALFGSSQASTLKPICLDSILANGSREEEHKASTADPKAITSEHSGSENWSLYGLVSDTNRRAGRSSTDRQFVYINRRPVVFSKLTRACNELYRSLVPNASPVLFLSLNSPNAQIDVNLQPDKMKVQFEGEDAVVSGVYEHLDKFWKAQLSNVALISASQKEIVDHFPRQKPVEEEKSDDAEASSRNSGSIESGAEKQAEEEAERRERESLPRQAGRQVEEVRRVKTASDSVAEERSETVSSHVSASTLESQPNLLENAMKAARESADLQRDNKNGQGQAVQRNSEQARLIPDRTPRSASSRQRLEEGDATTKVTHMLDNRAAIKSRRNRETDHASTFSHLREVNKRRALDLLEKKPKSLAEAMASRKRRLSKSSRVDEEAAQTQTKRQELEDETKDAAGPEPDAGFSTGVDARDGDKVALHPETSRTGNQFAAVEHVEIDGNKLGDLKALPDDRRTRFKSRLGLAEIVAALDSKEENIRKRRVRLDTSNSFSEGSIENPSVAEDEADKELRQVFKKEWFEEMRVVGQFNLGFIICKLGMDLFIIDQHAADEKFNFEDLTKNNQMRTQPYVQAKQLHLSTEDELVVADHLQSFRAGGFNMEYDDSKDPTERVKLLSAPYSQNTVFSEEDVLQMISEVRLITQRGGRVPAELRPRRIRDMLASRACRKSIMIGTALEATRMDRVVKALSTLDSPWNCPHGRPTMRHLCRLRKC